MKSGLIAAALLALPGGALAFVANPALSGTARAADVTMTVGQVAIWDFDAPGTGTGRIDLPKGADFALEVDNNDETEDSGLVTLSDAGGRAIVSTPIQGGEDVSVGGTTFRTPYAGTYVVKVRLDNANFPGRAIIVVDKDCAASKATLCTLPVGVTRSNRLFNYGGIYPVDIHADIDWFRTSLSRGRRYDVRLDEQYPDPYG